MRATVFVSTFIALSTVGTLARAQGSYMTSIGSYYDDKDHSGDPRYEKSSNIYRDFSVSTPGTRRLIRTGALLLGIDWAVCAGITLSALMATGDTSVAQMAIPFYATAGWAVDVFPEAPGAGMLLLVPSVVQAAGAAIIIAGLVKRHRVKKRLMAGVAPIVLPNGGAVGITFSM